MAIRRGCSHGARVHGAPFRQEEEEAASSDEDRVQESRRGRASGVGDDTLSSLRPLELLAEIHSVGEGREGSGSREGEMGGISRSGRQRWTRVSDIQNARLELIILTICYTEDSSS